MWISGLLTPRNVLRVVGGGLVAVGLWSLYLGALPMWGLTGLGVGVPALVIGMFFDWLTSRGRARKSLQMAMSIGWRYVDDLPGLLAPLTVAPFTAHELRYRDVMTGTFQGVECYDGVLEWHIRVDKDFTITGANRVTAVRLADILPRIMLVPEGLGGKIIKTLGGTDKDFESSAFNKAWRVLADDSRVAHDMLNPRVIEVLERQAIRAPLLFEKGFGVRIGDDAEAVGDLASRLSALVALAKYLPEHVIQDHGRFANSPGPLPSVATPGALTGGYNPSIAEADAAFEATAAASRKQRWSSRRRQPGEAPPPMYGGHGA